MSRIRQVLVAAGTFSVALGIGFVMQNGDALAARFSDSPVQPMAVPDAGPVLSARPAPQPGTAAYLVRQHIAAGAIAALPRAPSTSEVVTAAVPAQETAVVPVVAPAEVEQPVFDMGDLAAPAIEATVASLIIAPEPAAPPAGDAPILQAALETDPLPPVAEPFVAEPPAVAAPECTVGMVATAMPAAMVELDIDAPCAPEARMAIHHQGMMFSVITDAAGQATLSVPALAESAVFIADLGDGSGAVAVTTVPDLGIYDRVVLQWQGQSGPEIHALEFGAGYSDEGHVWYGAARDATVALSGDGGFLVRLGDGEGLNPLMAEVYTYPSNDSARAGNVAFTIETPVTADNCGSQISAQTIQVSPGAELFSLDLAMTVPGCDAVGEFLILKNMLLDLTLAVR